MASRLVGATVKAVARKRTMIPTKAPLILVFFVVCNIFSSLDAEWSSWRLSCNQHFVNMGMVSVWEKWQTITESVQMYKNGTLSTRKYWVFINVEQHKTLRMTMINAYGSLFLMDSGFLIDSGHIKSISNQRFCAVSLIHELLKVYFEHFSTCIHCWTSELNIENYLNIKIY